MGKSKKRKVYDNGKENDQLRTVAGLSNIGEAIEEALAKDGGDIIEAEVVTETNTDTAQPEQSDEVKTDQPVQEETKPEPEQQVNKPCKPVPHWSSDPGAQFNNLFNEVIELMCATKQSDEFITEFRNETLSMPTREDAIASLNGLIQRLKPIVEAANVPVDVENNNNKSMEEKKMENSNNVNTTTPVAPATATITQDQLNALMAAQQQAVAKPAQSTSALTTTEKVVLWTAAGVAVTALIVGFVAVAKASKANGRINDLELGSQL